MTAPSPALTDLAHSYGIATHYTDWRGRPVDVPADAVRDVLAAMDVDVSDPERALADRWEAPWRRMLPPCVVVAQGEQRTVPVHVPHGDPAAVSLALEAGGQRELEQTGRLGRPARGRRGAWSGRPRSRCRPTCRSATTPSPLGPATGPPGPR